MHISIRIAEERDVEQLAALRKRWNEERFEEEIDDPAFAAAFRTWWEDERATRTFFIVEGDGTPIGMANVKRYRRMPAAGQHRAGEWGYVGNVFVLPEHRDTGIGQALMEHLTTWAGSAGLVHLRLAPSPRSVTFYERLGFVPGAVVELDPPSG